MRCDVKGVHSDVHTLLNAGLLDRTNEGPVIFPYDDRENAETDSWLDFAKDCGYISTDQHQGLVTKCKSVGSMLGSMMKNPDPFIIK